MPAVFGYEKHPVIFVPIGRFNHSNLTTFVDPIANAVTALAQNHEKEKGLIHLPSYMLGQAILPIIKQLDEGVFNRILFHDSKTRLSQLSKHIESKENTIIMSPSFYEGIDLKDDLSRWQVFTKIPYGNLGDRIVKIHFDRNKNRYSWNTVKRFIQGIGRSVRGEDDYATSYILDGNFESLYNHSRKYFDDVGFEFIRLI